MSCGSESGDRALGRRNGTGWDLLYTSLLLATSGECMVGRQGLPCGNQQAAMEVVQRENDGEKGGNENGQQ